MKDDKKCGRCEQRKPLSHFPRNKARKDGVAGWCRECNNVKHVLYTYGLSWEELHLLFKLQDGRCRICKRVFARKSRRPYVVDHCHTTKKVCWLLCNTCNTGIGKFNDDAELLQAAADYCKRTRLPKRNL